MKRKYPGSSIVQPRWIQPGKSITSPEYAITATHKKRVPYFMRDNVRSLPAMTEIHEPTTSNHWRRRQKSIRADKINRQVSEVPSFEEAAFGSFQYTNPPAPMVSRGAWGKVESVLSANVEENSDTEPELELGGLELPSGWPSIGVILTAGIAGYFLFVRR